MLPFVDVHTHRPQGGAIELVAIQTPNAAEGFCSLGIHPWRIGELSDAQIACELKMVECAKVAAIGETGADSLRGGELERQLDVLEEHIKIAQRRNLPIIIHSVKCFEAIMQRLAKYPLRAVIFHSWVGSTQQAQQATKRGYYLSFGPHSLSSSRSIEALKNIDRSLLLTESDDSGEEIAKIYNDIANLRECSHEELQQMVYNNFKNIWQSGWNAPSCCSEARS